MEALFFGIGIGIVGMSAAAWGMFDRWVEHKEKLAEKDDVASQKIAALSSENEQLSQHIIAMHDRVAMLERIATDRETSSAKLSDEIENLRS
ncbi:MAG: hypothetical protein AAFX04_04345 [Pseudomonadota bacterium]